MLVGTAGIWMTWRFAPDTDAQRARSLDLQGQLTGAVALAALTFASIEVSALGWHSAYVAGSFARRATGEPGRRACAGNGRSADFGGCLSRDTLVLAMPVAWRGTLQQYAGRLHREHAGKTGVRVIDYVDGGHPVLQRMWEKRQRGYRAMGYQVRTPGEDIQLQLA